MIIAIDIGGTKTLVASFSKEKQIQQKYRFPTPDNSNEFLKELIKQLNQFNKDEIEAISIAAPGMVSSNGTILRCGRLSWENFTLKKDLAQSYNCPIHVGNDADLAGLSEAQEINPTPALCLYLTISTGIGSGIIINGHLEPAFANSEAGHMVLQTKNGLRNWQDYASGKAIKEYFKHQAVDIHSANDWKEIVDNLSQGLLALIPALQPNIIVLGGSVGDHFQKFAPQLREVLRDRLPDFIDLPEIKEAVHPNEAVLYGCYINATQQTPA
ncbi:MAG: ROK family protein [Candidatus Woesebacteria bacterium]|jgi:predicted NBD/HSP70 family sugar kinase